MDNAREQSTLANVGRPIFFGADPFSIGPYDKPVYIYPDTVPVLNTLIFGTAKIGRAWLATTLLMRMKRAGYNVRITVVDPHGDFKEKMIEALGLKHIIVGKTGYVDVFSSEWKGIDRLIERTSGGVLRGLEELKQRFAQFFVGDVLPIAEAKDLAISFAEDVVKSPMFIRVYITLLAHQLHLHAEPKNGEIWIIIFNINSTYIVKKILKYLMLSARKLGIAVWLITDDVKILADESVLSSTMIKIILGGHNVLDLVRRANLRLRPEEVEWLYVGRGGPNWNVPKAWTLLIHGPSDNRRLAFAILEPIK